MLPVGTHAVREQVGVKTKQYCRRVCKKKKDEMEGLKSSRYLKDKLKKM